MCAVTVSAAQSLPSSRVSDESRATAENNLRVVAIMVLNAG
jgi:hypothetical protein